MTAPQPTSDSPVRAGIFGATGYAGHELSRILDAHPQVEIAFAASGSQAGRNLRDLYADAPSLGLVSYEEADLSCVDVALLCLPHGASARTALRALDAGARVIDLSADFRLSDAEAYQRWYGLEHPAPERLPEAVYGLSEHERERLPQAKLVANPGCYATSILLPLLPLVQAGALSRDAARPIIADSKSGVSGAGRKPQTHTLFGEVAENFSPYAIGRAHRHLPEMEQAIERVAGEAGGAERVPRLIFSPHLLPVHRGILSTIYLPLAAGWDVDRVREILASAYADEPFLRVLSDGELATLAHTRRSNGCVIGLSPAGPGLAILSVSLDNLVKGAAGQAVQNLNLMFGLSETAGLAQPAPAA